MTDPSTHEPDPAARDHGLDDPGPGETSDVVAYPDQRPADWPADVPWPPAQPPNPPIGAELTARGDVNMTPTAPGGRPAPQSPPSPVPDQTVPQPATEPEVEGAPQPEPDPPAEAR